MPGDTNKSRQISRNTFTILLPILEVSIADARIPSSSGTIKKIGVVVVVVVVAVVVVVVAVAAAAAAAVKNGQLHQFNARNSIPKEPKWIYTWTCHPFRSSLAIHKGWMIPNL